MSRNRSPLVQAAKTLSCVTIFALSIIACDGHNESRLRSIGCFEGQEIPSSLNIAIAAEWVETRPDEKGKWVPDCDRVTKIDNNSITGFANLKLKQPDTAKMNARFFKGRGIVMDMTSGDYYLYTESKDFQKLIARAAVLDYISLISADDEMLIDIGMRNPDVLTFYEKLRSPKPNVLLAN